MTRCKYTWCLDCREEDALIREIYRLRTLIEAVPGKMMLDELIVAAADEIERLRATVTKAVERGKRDDSSRD